MIERFFVPRKMLPETLKVTFSLRTNQVGAEADILVVGGGDGVQLGLKENQ